MTGIGRSPYEGEVPGSWTGVEARSADTGRYALEGVVDVRLQPPATTGLLVLDAGTHRGDRDGHGEPRLEVCTRRTAEASFERRRERVLDADVVADERRRERGFAEEDAAPLGTQLDVEGRGREHALDDAAQRGKRRLAVADLLELGRVRVELVARGADD